MKQHPGYFWPCLWLFFIFFSMPTYWQFKNLDRLADSFARIETKLDALLERVK